MGCKGKYSSNRKKKSGGEDGRESKGECCGEGIKPLMKRKCVRLMRSLVAWRNGNEEAITRMMIMKASGASLCSKHEKARRWVENSNITKSSHEKLKGIRNIITYGRTSSPHLIIFTKGRSLPPSRLLPKLPLRALPVQLRTRAQIAFER